jgi:hypothetical protein
MATRSRAIAAALVVVQLTSCTDASDRPPIEVKIAPSEADRRAAQKALEQDFAALTDDEARAVAAAENRRNDELERSLGGAAAARSAECSALELEIAKLAELQVAAATAAERNEFALAVDERKTKADAVCE